MTPAPARRFAPRLLLALGLLGPPAVWAQGATFSESDLVLRVGGIERTAMDVGGQLRSDGVRLRHSSSGLSGSLFGVQVDLRTQAGGMTGTLGGQPVSVRVTAISTSLAYEGLVGAERISGVVSPQLLSASLGRCMAALGFASRSYEGMLDCGQVTAPAQPMSVALPSSLSGISAEAQVALVVTLVWSARDVSLPDQNPLVPEQEEEPAPEEEGEQEAPAPEEGTPDLPPATEET